MVKLLILTLNCVVSTVKRGRKTNNEFSHCRENNIAERKKNVERAKRNDNTVDYTYI